MSGECILVIDDSKEIVRHLTERVLPTFGYKTLFAYDGQSGLKLIRESNPDLIMLDYNLPEMTGIDVLRQMAQESLGAPVVLMTGYGSELSAIEAFRLGAKDYLIKPFTIDEIVDTIDRALGETRLLHDKEELAEQLRRTKVELSRQSQEMETLFSIGKAITSLLSVGQVLERVLEAATYLTDAEDSTIWLVDGSGESLRAYEKRGGQAASDAQLVPVEGSQIGQVMRTGRPLRQSFFTGRSVRTRNGILAHAILYVPLKLRGVTMGVLEVTNREARRSFSRRDEFLLSFLGDYAAIALENARVFQAADQALAAGLEELHTLIEITRTITSTLDLNEVLRLTIHQVHDSWHIEASSLWLLDEHRHCLRVLANVGTPHDVLSQFEIPIGRGFVGYVVQTGKWIMTNHAAQHDLHFRDVDAATGFETRSILSVPLTFRGRVIGALQLLNKQDGDFDDRDVEKAISIGAAVAIATTNALLYQELESRRHYLEATMEYSENPILITDAHNTLLMLNRQAQERLYVREADIGQALSDIAALTELGQILAPPVQDVYQREVTFTDGSMWQLRIVQIPGNGRILTFQDTFKFKELKRIKDQFVANFSHDMRAPLNIVIGFANSLSLAGPLTAQQELFVNSILKATGTMMDLVNGLLELAKIDALQQTFQPCDLNHIITDAIHSFQDQALSHNIRLIFHTDHEAEIVVGDPNQLRSAITNLLDNAIKYSLPGSEIQVALQGHPDHILLQVKDQGTGISDADMPYIFERFYRGQNTSNGIQGIGLGLALVQSIVRAHGGQVWVQSRPNEGSTFYLSLPVLKGGSFKPPAPPTR